MAKTTIERLGEFGQSVWLDNINRSMIKSGRLKEMIGLGLRGMTSNPTIFDKAISSSADYDERIKELAGSGKSTFQIYDDLTIRDIQDAADIFKPVYEKTSGLDGYVSLEINPKLALKTGETIEEGSRLFKKVNRPNVMFKVPSTEPGFRAIEELLSEGININITLIFSLEQYVKTARAFLRGIQRLSQKEKDLSKVNSVASVFVSRIDTLADKLIGEKKGLQHLMGKTAAANSRLIYKRYLEIFSGDKFKKLKEKGANIQRVLWGSTSTKNPNYSDIKYVTELIGRDTVNTMPDKTFEAFLDHGVVKEGLTSDIGDARTVIDNLRSSRIQIEDVCGRLLEDGVKAFERSFDSLLASIEEKAGKLCKKE